MKISLIFAACLCLLMAASSVCAEYYQYTDQNGIRHFTDDISEVPEAQREKVVIHQGTQSPETTEVEALTEEEAPVITKESVEAERAALFKEYSALTDKRDQLNAQKSQLDPNEYEAQATQLNQEIEAYQKRNQAYDRMREEYANQNQSQETSGN